MGASQSRTVHRTFDIPARLIIRLFQDTSTGAVSRPADPAHTDFLDAVVASSAGSPDTQVKLRVDDAALGYLQYLLDTYAILVADDAESAEVFAALQDMLQSIATKKLLSVPTVTAAGEFTLDKVKKGGKNKRKTIMFLPQLFTIEDTGTGKSRTELLYQDFVSSCSENSISLAATSRKKEDLMLLADTSVEAKKFHHIFRTFREFHVQHSAEIDAGLTNKIRAAQVSYSLEVAEVAETAGVGRAALLLERAEELLQAGFGFLAVEDATEALAAAPSKAADCFRIRSSGYYGMAVLCASVPPLKESARMFLELAIGESLRSKKKDVELWSMLDMLAQKVFGHALGEDSSTLPSFMAVRDLEEALRAERKTVRRKPNSKSIELMIRKNLISMDQKAKETVLDFSFHDFSDLRVAGVLVFTKVERLNLSNCKLSAFDFADLADLPALHELDLRGNGISKLSGIVSRNSALATIDLSFNKIADVDPLFRALEEVSSNIRSLNLVGNPFWSDFSDAHAAVEFVLSYRFRVLSLLPKLEALDTVGVTETHRLMATLMAKNGPLSALRKMFCKQLQIDLQIQLQSLEILRLFLAQQHAPILVIVSNILQSLFQTLLLTVDSETFVEAVRVLRSATFLSLIEDSENLDHFLEAFSSPRGLRAVQRILEVPLGLDHELTFEFDSTLTELGLDLLCSLCVSTEASDVLSPSFVGCGVGPFLQAFPLLAKMFSRLLGQLCSSTDRSSFVVLSPVKSTKQVLALLAQMIYHLSTSSESLLGKALPFLQDDLLCKTLAEDMKRLFVSHPPFRRDLCVVLMLLLKWRPSLNVHFADGVFVPVLFEFSSNATTSADMNIFLLLLWYLVQERPALCSELPASLLETFVRHFFAGPAAAASDASLSTVSVLDEATGDEHLPMDVAVFLQLTRDRTGASAGTGTSGSEDDLRSSAVGSHHWLQNVNMTEDLFSCFLRAIGRASACP